ncbi:MAG: PD-(D/E)XK motif protein [Cyclobacteriaceae bacterium]|nr:PD-(D/E)XK motif protein [Cyclobacteriaceae bacterium]
MNLVEIFNIIEQPSENGSFQFSAIPIPEYSNHRIAKDKYNNPTLLLSTSSQEAETVAANMKLQNVSVLFDIKCKIHQGGNLLEKTFTVVCFIGKDVSLKKYFLKLCSTLLEDLGNSPSQDEIRKEITRFIELFRLATEPQTKTIQGLWAELLLIAESKEPANLIRCWHSIPEEKLDFNNGDERIEVKSSSNSLRVHNFSIDQLNSPSNTQTLIASVFVRQASVGKSIEALSNEISERLSDTELTEKLQLQIALTLGKAIRDSMKLKFDYEYAKDSLQFYRTEDIPKIDIENIPRFVSDVRFKSDLTGLKPVIPMELMADGSLFNSL